MTSLRCTATYQGLGAKRCEFRRSPGLRPEYGSIDLDLQDLGQIRIAGRDVPWRAVGGFEMGGQIDIRSWAKIKPGTTTALPDLPRPQGGGLNMFGVLRLSTIDHDTGNVVEEVAYHEVYVAPSGIEEVTKGLTEADLHVRGTIRIPLTDVRWWFGKCGGLWGGINVRLKSGQWDKGTTKEGGEPWSLSEVIRFLFSQLPGSPSVISSSEVFSMGGSSAPPPGDIIGKGEPVVEHLQKLLDRYGLIASMRPDASWSVDRRGSNRYGHKEGPDGGGGSRDLRSLPTHNETKTCTVTDRPPAVCVTGPRRIRRITVPYVPVLEDVDGKIYRIEAVVKRWGYSMKQLNNNVFVASERQFRDIPPSIGQGGGRLHEKRVKLARRAYRMYAPAFLFEGAAESTEVAGGLSQDRVDECPYLPMKPAPWYVSDLAGQGLQVPKDSLGSKGDKEDYILMPPVARGSRVGSAFLNKFDEIENYFSGFIASNTAGVEAFEAFVSFTNTLKGTAADALVAISKGASRTISGGKLSEFGAGSMAREFDEDVKKIAKDVGRTLGVTDLNALIEGGYHLQNQLRAQDQMAKTANELLKTMKNQKTRWESRFKSFKKVFEDYGGVYVRGNIAYDLLESGSYSVDLETGVLQASEPLCQVNQPMFFDGDNASVVDDGKVTVTFAYELKDNTIAAFSSFLFTAGDAADDQPGRPVLAGVCRSSPAKARCEPMNGRLYEMDMGTPVNLNACAAEAWQKAGAILGQPKVVTGYTYEFSGLYAFPLAAGVSGVQYILDGHFGRTVLMINAPGAAGPLGPPGIQKHDVATVDTREHIDRETGR